MSDRVSAQVVATNITGTVQVKVGSGRTIMVSVNALAGGQIDIHDVATVGAISPGNRVASLPDLVGTYLVDMPHLLGIAVVAGVGTCAVGYV